MSTPHTIIPLSSDLTIIRYLFSEFGERLHVEQVYKLYPRLNEIYLGTHWGVQAMRHAMIAIAKAFIMASRAFSDAERAMAENSDHSLETELHHYSLKFGDVARLTNFTVAQGRWVARQWQSVLGMSGPPPRPLKDRALFEDEDLSTRVMKLVEAKLAAELPTIMANAIKMAIPALIATSVSSSLGTPLLLYISY